MNATSMAAPSNQISPPMVSCQADHATAVPLPSATRVSIVALPCRSAATAAVQNGHPAPKTTIGARMAGPMRAIGSLMERPGIQPMDSAIAVTEPTAATIVRAVHRRIEACSEARSAPASSAGATVRRGTSKPAPWTSRRTSARATGEPAASSTDPDPVA